MRMRETRALATAMIVAAAAQPATGQTTPGATPEQRYFDWAAPRFPAAEYAARRAAMIARLDDTGDLFLAPGAHGRSHGETFRQLDDFSYFTGLELPGSALVLDGATGEAILFAPPRDFRFESASRPNDFPGRPLADDPAIADWSGLERVRPFDELEEALAAWAAEGRAVRLNPGRPGPIRTPVSSLSPDWGAAEHAILHLRSTHPELRLVDGYSDVAALRMIKSPAEIETMRRAATLTASAIREAAGVVRPGADERALEAAFESACKRGGSQRIGFASIIKSGPNSLWPWRILASHYDRRNRAMRDGELVIFDVGCEVDGYVSDVGRTLPVGGHFARAQRTIIEMEVAVADAIIGAVRPGVTLRDLQAAGEAAIPEEHRPYMQTGLFFGHHIGLSTGDPSLPEAPLAPGMVFTVEPWYYNHDLGISVFTEDIVLVTETGADVLTRGLPRRPEELERLVGTAGR